MLPTYKHPRQYVRLHQFLMVCGFDTTEKFLGNCQNGEVLNIRVVVGRVGHHVMHIMCSLPPSVTHTKEENQGDAHERVQLV